MRKQQLGGGQYLGSDREQIQIYMDWLGAPANPSISLEIFESTACVFGLRTGTSWKFYVQEHMVSSVVRVVDRSMVRSEINPAGDKVYKSVLTSAPAVVQTKLVTTKHFGPFRFGSKVSKTFAITEHMKTVPIGVREIFPKSGHVILPDEFVVKAQMI